MNFHYNYCGNCNDYTPHTYERSGGIRWELCTNNHFDVDYSLARIATLIEGKTK